MNLSKKSVTPQPFNNAPQGYDIAVVSPNGVFGTVPSAEIAAATDSGYRLDTPEVRKDIELQQKYGEGFGNEAAAFGLGAARSLSFGLSDLALAKSGAVSPERLRETKERNPNASLAGEIGGFAVPLAGNVLGAIKGAGAVAKGVGLGARIAGAGVSKVSSIGAGIAEEITRATGSAVMGSAAQVAAESFAYNIAQNLTESVLGEKEITAQRLLAHSGQAMAIGAGLGFGIPLAGKAVVAAATKAKQAMDTFGTTLVDKILPAAGEKFAKGYSNLYGSVTGKGKDAADEVYAMVSGSFTGEGAAKQKEIVRAISPDANDEIIRTFNSQLSDVHDATEKAVKLAYRTSRPEEMVRLLENVELAPAADDLARLIGVTREASAKLAAEPLLYDQFYMRKLQVLADELEKKGGFGSAVELHSFVDSVKKTALSDLVYGTPIKTLEGAKREGAYVAEGVYKEFAKHLENPKIYGDAGARQSALNEAFSAYKRTLDKGENNFRKFFMTNGEVDANKAKIYLRKISTAGAERHTAALEEYQAAARNIVEQAELSAAGAGAKAEFHGVGHIGDGLDRAGFEGLARNLVDTQLKAAKDLAFENKIRQQDMLGTAFLRFQETFGSNFMNSGAFSATVKLAQKAASPFGVVKTLSFANGIAMDSGKRAAKAVSGFLDKAGAATAKGASDARRYAEPAALKVLLGAAFDDEEEKAPKTRAARFTRATAKIADLVADPGSAAAKLGGGLHTLYPHAPGLAQEVIDTQMRGAAFLHDKAPKNEAASMTLNPFVQAWQPSDGEISKWERYAAAVQDPLSVLEELEHGTISAEAIEAVQAVYPALFDDIKTQLMEKVSELKTIVPYRDRVQLSLLFGVALDASLDPSFVSAVQNGYSQATSQASESKPAYRSSSASKKIGANEETVAQRIARR